MGFPSRILRQHLGMKLRDARPVEHPELEVGAKRLNLLEHTAVGCGLVTPRASLVAEWNSGTNEFNILHQEESWNTDHTQAKPTLTRSSAGIYTYQFADTYKDNDGVDVAPDFCAARVFKVNQVLSDASIDCSVTSTAVVLTLEQTGAPADFRFWLEVL